MKSLLRFKKNIATLLVCVLLVTSIFYSFPRMAKAQLGGDFFSSLNIQGVGAVALQCATANGASSPFQSIGSEVQGLFGGGSADGAGDAADAAEGEIPSEISQAAGGLGQSVPVGVVEDSETAKNIEESNEKIKAEEKKQTKKEECLDRIAQAAAIAVMDKMTLATLNWINSGFEGKPFFLENPEQFFTDLATQEILGFSASFSADANLYPFGQTLVRTVLTSFQRTFEQSMVNNLNAVLNGTQAEWEANFSVGGWAGYTAFVESNNNIFGSYLESSAQLNRRLNGTSNSVAINAQAELSQGFGFLSQKICVETEDGGEYIPQNSIRHISVGVSEITDVSQIPTNTYFFLTTCSMEFDTDGDGEDDTPGECIESDETVVDVAENYRARSNCLEWRNQTPGTLIAQATSDAIGTSKQQLLLVDELNENLGLILDAFLNQLISEGVSYFSPDNQNNTLVSQINGENPGQQQNTAPLINVINGFGGQNNIEAFSGFIPLTEEYITKTSQLISLYQEQIQRTFDLDYCVPGPNVLWQTPAATTLANALTIVPSYESIPLDSWVQSTTQVAPYAPEQWEGLFVGLVGFTGVYQGQNDSNIYEYANEVYAQIIQALTGVGIDEDELEPAISSSSQFSSKIYDTFSDYNDIINERFILNNDFDEGVRDLLQEKFPEITTIQAVIPQYQNALSTAEETLQELNELRELYADIERAYIVEQLDIAVNQQGIATLADNLQTFQSFSAAQVTYVGVNGQNSPYHNAVDALTAEIGYAVAPPTNYPGYQNILSDFTDVLPNIPSQQDIEDIEDEIENVTDVVGDPTDDNTLTGAIYSCIQQITSTGPFQGVPFTGYTQRKPYPFPISQDIPGLNSLSTTPTFINNLTVSTQENQVTIELSPSSAVSSAPSIQLFELMVANLAFTLY